MNRFLLGLLVLVGLLTAGCGGRGTTAPSPNKEAQERAVAFYKAHYMAQDHAGAWDMTLPGTITGYKDRAEYVQRQSELFPPQPTEPFEVTEYQRVTDYLYLISNRHNQMLIWVTQRPDGWKVRAYEYYKGGPIPWDSE